MNPTTLQDALPASVLKHFFRLDTGLWRQTSKGWKKIISTNGGHYVTVFLGFRLYASDIAWALHYGNWPKFHLVNLSGDPDDLRVGINIMPARLKTLRYRETMQDGKFAHPLSRDLFATSADSFANWLRRATEYYMQDLAHVELLEKRERGYRPAQTHEQDLEFLAKHRRVIPEAISRRTRLSRPVAKREYAKRPAPVEGAAWHMHKGEWLAVPLACHPSDDLRNRIAAVLGGAVRAEYRPEGVAYFMPDGSEYRPALDSRAAPAHSGLQPE